MAVIKRLVFLLACVVWSPFVVASLLLLAFMLPLLPIVWVFKGGSLEGILFYSVDNTFGITVDVLWWAHKKFN
jgi:hypothetical protein